MHSNDIIDRKKQVQALATKHHWVQQLEDKNAKMLQFQDDCGIKLNIWLTKFTVAIIIPFGTPVYLRKQTLKNIEAIFKDPFPKRKKVKA